MSKNKGGREVRKPKQDKQPKSGTAPAPALKVESTGKSRPPR